jgi:hypothetical protein
LGRLHDIRQGYGNAGIVDPIRDVKAPYDAGLWRLDLATGRSDPLLSFQAIAWLSGLGGNGEG